MHKDIFRARKDKNIGGIKAIHNGTMLSYSERVM
jgi:hypothetical protein